MRSSLTSLRDFVDFVTCDVYLKITQPCQCNNQNKQNSKTNEVDFEAFRKMALKINFVNKDDIPPAWTRVDPTFAMDAVHHPDDRSWIDKPLKLDDHFSLFSRKVKESRGPELQSSDFKIVSKQKIRDLMEFGEENAIPIEVFNEVAANCELNNFDLPGELEPQQQFTEVKGKFPKFVPTGIPPKGVKTLKTLEMQEVRKRYYKYIIRSH